MNNKSKINQNEQSGVYKIECTGCDGIYVGQTGRNIKIRYKEHMTKKTSAVYKHVKQSKHEIPFENIKLLKNVKKSNEMNLLEEFYIHKFKDKNLLNDTSDLNPYRNFLQFI